ncbi:MAG: phosphoribosylformylglycinamidine synthase I [Candidatus Omnitrophica bacterium]|nr:phosphoribosylformylglycinamidine synthase I [Candidatus Omnitrophota bacterium]
MVKVLILRTSGTNCDFETEWAFNICGAKAERVHLLSIINGKKNINNYDILVIPGGFSYGDDLGAGKVFANEIKLKIWESIEIFKKSKKPIIGICNGFQVLVKAGIIPFWGKNSASLTWNNSGRYEDRWVYLKIESSLSPFFKNLPEIIRLPVAHAEGKFVVKDKITLNKIGKNKQIILKYVKPSGEISGYPYNPNGSQENIAGVCDESGLIIGLMPHHERALLSIHLPDWTRQKREKVFGYGYIILKNMVEYVS